MDKLISVIIPTYNAEQFIECCIQSILNQTYKNIEIIISDDSSNDNTLSICKALSSKYGQITILEHESNRGPMFERIEGIRASKGDYMVFCDADDYLPDKALSSLLEANKNGEYDIVIGNFAMTYDAITEIPNRNRLETGIHYQKELLKNQIDDGTLSGILISSMCGKLYKRNNVIKIPELLNPDIRINEDGMFNTYLLLNINSVLVIDEVTYIQRMWKKTKNLVSFSYESYYKHVDQELLKLRDNWFDVSNFDLQFQRRRLSETFWQCYLASRKLGIPSAYLYISKEFKRKQKSFIYSSMNKACMRKYKKILMFLMKNNMTLTFIVICRWLAPHFRKFIAR